MMTLAHQEKGILCLGKHFKGTKKYMTFRFLCEEVKVKKFWSLHTIFYYICPILSLETLRINEIIWPCEVNFFPHFQRSVRNGKPIKYQENHWFQGPFILVFFPTTVMFGYYLLANSFSSLPLYEALTQPQCLLMLLILEMFW